LSKGGEFVEVESVFQGRGRRDDLGECAILDDEGFILKKKEAS
jgi:hypothetical protein